jgi:hypothetical protein
MRGHAVVRHRPPRVVGRCQLREPHIAGVPGELPALQRVDDGVTVDDLAAGSVDQIR